MAEPGEDSSPAMASPEADQNSDERDSSIGISSELVDKISKAGLDPKYWLHIFQKELGVYNVESLKHIQHEDCKRIRKKFRNDWEERAIYSLCNIAKNDNTEKNKEALNKLQTLKIDRSQHDSLVKEIGTEVKNALSVPEISSTLPQELLVDLLEHFDKQTDLKNESYLDKESLIDEDVIRYASGGLALEGIFQTTNTDDVFKKREAVLCIPEGLKLVGQEQSTVFEQKEFTSYNQEACFRKTIEKVGLTLSASFSASFLGIGLDAGITNTKNSESEKTSKQSTCRTYFCTTRYNYIPLASCYFRKDQLKLSPPALQALQEIETFIGIKSNKQILATKCAEFFQRFGSHVNLGPIHFGGIFWWKASMEGVETKQMEEAREMTSKALSAHIRFSCGAFGAGFESSSTNMKGSVEKSEKSKLEKNVQISVTKTGGPTETDSLLQWKTGLVASNKTWSVIDRGFQLIPIWKIIVDNHKDVFTDGVKLAACLTDHYELQTGLTLQMMSGENATIGLLKANLFLQGVSFWNMYNYKECVKALTDFKQELCETTGSDCVWKDICLSDKNLNVFLEEGFQKQEESSAEEKDFIKASIRALKDTINNTYENSSWIYGKEEDVNPVCDFEELLNILHISMEKVLRIAVNKISFTKDLDQEKFRATTNISNSLDAFRNTLNYTNETDAELLIICIANNCGYCIKDQKFQRPLGYHEIEILMHQLEEYYEEYRNIRSQCIYRAQAFVFYTGLTSLDKYREMSENIQKTERLNFMKKHMEGRISPDVDNIIGQSSGHGDWQKLEDDLRAFIDGKQPKAEMKPYKDSKEEITSLLKRLNLDKYSPQSRMMPEISQASLTEEDIFEEKQLPLHFLQKLLMSDYHARYIQCACRCASSNPTQMSQEEDKINASDFFEQFLGDENSKHQNTISEQSIHPMDVQMAILNCANDFTRQFIYTKLSFCQFALPLLVTRTDTNSMEFPLWSFQAVKKMWRNKSGQSSDKFVKEMETPIVSFIHLGPSAFSKSQLMNRLIGKDKQNIFYHRDCGLGSQNVLLVNGVPEIAWYCPDGKKDDAFDDCIAFTNLHGDAREHDQQMQFLQSISSVVVIVFNELDRRDNKSKELLQQLLKSPKALICVLVDKDNGLAASGSKIKIGVKNRSDAELLRDISKAIKYLLGLSQDRYSLNEVAGSARKHGFLVDEDKEECKQGKQQAESLLLLLKKECVPAMKEAFLPLQGDLWHKWSKKDKEMTRLKQNSNMTIEQQRSNIESEKQAIREEQLKRAFPINNFIEGFLKILGSGSEDSNMYFLQWLKINLNSLSSDTLTVLYHEYYNLRLEMKEGNQLGKNKKTIEKIKKLAADIDVSTFGLEHILREMGQIYEAFQKKKDEEVFKLPKIAANLMVSGYPLELMDGNAAHVPLQWIGAILDELREILGDKKLYVLSVLGLPSTGKSTLLNAMFGLQFALGAGRCTKGAFMQLVEVDEKLRQEMNLDYVLVIDTEGLTLAETAFTHDNELATFVIGLSNLTLINIFGEDPSEMLDILQIAVHAFLRMKKNSLKPSCLFVHQNVDKITGKEKIVEAQRQLQEKLDEMTICAAQLERSDAICFDDVIKFNANTHIHYFAHLWESDSSMAPPSPRYSQDVQTLRQVILDSGKQEKQQHIFRISTFKTHIIELWNSLLKENFVFSFKNSLEISTHKNLEVKYIELTWKLRECVSFLQNQIIHQVRKDKIKEVNADCLNEHFKLIYKTLLEELKTFPGDEKDFDVSSQWRMKTENRLAEFADNLKQELYKRVNESIQLANNDEKISKLLDKYENEMLAKGQDLAFALKEKENTEEELLKEFNRMWLSLISEVTQETYTPTPSHIYCDLENVFLEHYSNEVNIIDKITDSYTWTNILDTFPKHISAKCEADIWPKTLSDDEKGVIGRVTQALDKDVDEYIDTKQDYQSFYFHEILHIISSEVRNTLGTLKFKCEYTLNVSLLLCQKAANRFLKMSDAFRQANDPLLYLECKKDEFCQKFKIYCKEMNLEMLADLMCMELREVIKQAVSEKSVEQLSKIVKSKHEAFQGNKSNLELCLLKSLAEKESFLYYRNYIKNPSLALSNFINECVEQICNEPGQSEIHKLEMVKNLHHSLDTVLRAIVMATELIDDSDAVTICEWLDIFCSHLGCDLKLSNDDFKIAKQQLIRDVDTFNETMSQRVTTWMFQPEDYFTTFDFTQIVKEVQAMIVKEFSGCCKQCPFCGAMCIISTSDHEGDHKVLFHRPLAVNGGAWKKTNNFSLEICPSLMYSDLLFVCNCEEFNCRTYRDAGPPLSSLSLVPDSWSSTYWKWVICCFQKKFESYYHCKFIDLGNIPPQWLSITKEEAILGLFITTGEGKAK